MYIDFYPLTLQKKKKENKRGSSLEKEMLVQKQAITYEGKNLCSAVFSPKKDW